VNARQDDQEMDVDQHPRGWRARYRRKVGEWRQARGLAWYAYVGFLASFFGAIGQAAALLIDRKSRAAGDIVAWMALTGAVACYGYGLYQAGKWPKRR